MNNDIFNGRVNLYDNTQKKVININDITNEPPIYVKNQQNVYTLFFSQGNMDI